MSIDTTILVNDRKELSENAIKILEKRYLLKDENGKIIETPDQLFRRVARDIAKAEKDPKKRKEYEEKFYRIMKNLEFMPNTPTLMNAGTVIQQLSACFVIPVGDSMEEIFEAVKHTAIIHKSGGGTGFSFSRLRPKGDMVSTTKGVASGPVSFMRVFNEATETVKQGGKRRGANMGILRVDHPDIVEFIKCKEKEGEFANFNISVAVTDEFMEAVKKGEKYNLVNPRTREVVGQEDARKIFDMIVEGAWRNGEPGIIFLDEINRHNPTPEVGEIESTNPCGEQPLLPYESCNLGSINLSKFVKPKGKKMVIDYDHLGEVVEIAVRFLDNVIDRNKFPLKQIEENTKANRKIGLGVMGFADMLIQLGIRYDTPEAEKKAEEVMKFIQEKAVEATKKLAKEKGPFPNFEKSIYKNDEPRRNATVTTIAPTGTISMIAGCSPGIEPLFAVTYVKNVLDGEKLLEVNPYFEKLARAMGFYSKELMEKISETGSVQKFEEVPEEVKNLFVTAHDIDPEWHVRIQAAFQKYTDNAVSKTINFRHEATVDDVRRAYLLAYELKCKGITVYRDGSRRVQVVTRAKEKEGEIENGRDHPKTPRKRPKVMRGATQEIRTGCGDLYITINEDDKGPFELFAQMGKSGGCIASFTEAIGRLVSLSLRAGVKPEAIIKQLTGIRCPRPSWEPGGKIYSCPDAVGRALERYIKGMATSQQASVQEFIKVEGEPQKKLVLEPETVVEKGMNPECPECGGMLEPEGGCYVCKNCGYSECE